MNVYEKFTFSLFLNFKQSNVVMSAMCVWLLRLAWLLARTAKPLNDFIFYILQSVCCLQVYC